MIRLAHLADLHVGAALRDLDPYPGAAEIGAVGAAHEAFARLVADVIAARPDAVLVAGDVFDRDVPRASVLSVVQRAFDAFHEAGLPVALIAGNHDAETGSLEALRLPPSATLLGGAAPTVRVWDDLGLAVVGRSIVRADEPDDLAAGYPEASTVRSGDELVVGLLHTSLTGERSRRVCAPTGAEVLDRTGYDYWALGHVHAPFAAGGATPAWFAGGGHARRAEETGPRGWLEVRLPEDRVGGVEVELHATAPVRYEAVPLDGFEALLADAPAHEDAVVWVLPPARAGLLAETRRIADADPGAMVVLGR